MNHKLRCTPDDCQVAAAMRGFCPVPDRIFKKFILVELESGDTVAEHQHPEHTVLFYPKDSSPVMIQPTAGTMIYLPPGTLHSVPPPGKNRLSLAMIIDTVERQ